jgi:hypothetical protein
VLKKRTLNNSFAELVIPKADSPARGREILSPDERRGKIKNKFPLPIGEMRMHSYELRREKG